MSIRSEKAKELFYSGYNCCQSVVGAFQDCTNVDFETLMKLCDGLGGGMGRMRLTCGAVSATAIIAGALLSTGKPGDLKNRGEVYLKVREMANAFKYKHGTLICAEILGNALPKDNGATPEARTPEYYKKRPCPECIACCAEIIENFLLTENSDKAI